MFLKSPRELNGQNKNCLGVLLEDRSINGIQASFSGTPSKCKYQEDDLREDGVMKSEK